MLLLPALVIKIVIITIVFLTIATTKFTSTMTAAAARNINIGGRDEEVEGCFNDFAYECAFELGPTNRNNLRCQAHCTEQGYALAATGRLDWCFCGNDYPSEGHRVSTSLCDLPCNPDKTSCYLFTCCGDRNGTLFTVGWSGEVDPMRQVLRRLTHDYRNSSSSATFRRKIEEQYFGGGGGAMSTTTTTTTTTTTLRFLPFDDGKNQKNKHAKGHLHHHSNKPQLYLSVGNGCPSDGWCLHDDTCYKLHWAEPSSYKEASAKCRAEDKAPAELVRITSEEENSFVKDLYGGCQGWIHAESSLHPPSASSSSCLQLARDGSWVALPSSSCFGDDDDEDEDEDMASCFICKRHQDAPLPALRPQAHGQPPEEWRMEVVVADDRQQHPSSSSSSSFLSASPPQAPPAPCFQVFLWNCHANQYLCADDQNWLYLSYQNDHAWCLWTLIVQDPNIGALAFWTPHGTALFYDEDSGLLSCRGPAPTGSASASASSHPALFQASRLPYSIAIHYLRISVQSLSRRLLSPELGGAARGGIAAGGKGRGYIGPLRECSMAIYDTSPRSESFACRHGIPPSSPCSSFLTFTQVALLIFDQSSYVTAREPLPNGRLTCLNQSPTETVSCVFAYGQALILARRFRVQFSYILFDTIIHIKQINAEQGLRFRYPSAFGGGGGAAVGRRGAGASRGGVGRVGGGGGGGGRSNVNQLQFVNRASKRVQNDLTFAFNNFYQVINLKVAVESRNWQLGISTVPQTALTIQFWLTTHYLRYRWRALFQAQGGFMLTLFGQPLLASQPPRMATNDDNNNSEDYHTSCNDAYYHSLGDLSAAEDLTFPMYGLLEDPVEAAVTVTDIEHIELSYLGLPVQPYTTEEGAEI